MKKRILSVITALALCLSLLPAAAYAAISDLVGLGAVENAALLEALRAAYGEDAEAYLTILEQYGLLDEDGNLVTDEKIVMNGVEYTLEEIEAVLSSPDTDLDTVVEVDGQYLTLYELKQIVEIERYLAYVKATYFTPQEISPEQEASFYDLADAWANGEVNMAAPYASGNMIDGDGFNLGVKATFNCSGSTGTVTLDGTQSEAVTFKWRVLGGSAGGAQVIDSGEGSIAAGGTSDSFTFTPPSASGQAKGSETYLVQVYNLKNALFSGGGTQSEKQFTVSKNDAFKYSGSATGTLSYKTADTTDYYNYYVDMVPNISEHGDKNLKTNYAVSVERASATLNIDGLSSGTYEKKISFGSGTIARRTSDYWAGIASGIEMGGKEDNTPGNYQLTIDGTAFGGESSLSGLRDNGSISVPQKTDTQSGQLSGTVSHKLGIKTPVSRFYNGSGADYIGYSSSLYFIPAINIPVSLSVQETTTSTSVTLAAPAGEYFPGQHIPIVATFGFPMQIDNSLTINVNGTDLHPAESNTTADTCTFLYPVQEVDNATLGLTGSGTITGTGANGKTITASIQGGATQSFSGVNIVTPDRGKAFTSYTATANVDAATRKPTLHIEVTVSGNETLTAWLGSESAPLRAYVKDAEGAADGSVQAIDLKADANLTKLTADVPLKYNTSGQDKQYVVSFALKGWDGTYSKVMGKICNYTVTSTKPIGAENLKPTLTVTPSGGEGTNYGPNATVPLLYAQQDNALTLGFTVDGTDYTWGDKSKTSYYDADGNLIPLSSGEEPHFAWKSSDSTVASVSVNDGGSAVLTPTGAAGMTEITLTALNGSMDDAVSGQISVRFAVGQDPFLLIPASGKTISIREGQDAVINWSSNICQKNQEGTFVPTVFQVLVKYTTSEGEQNQTLTLTTDEQNPVISSATIPWNEILDGIYAAGARAVQVEVTTVYLDKTYGGADASATIRMTSQPAVITLLQPDGGLYQTDGGTGKSLTLNWAVEHLDAQGGGQFELYVASTNKSFGSNGILSVTGLETANARSYPLTIPAVELKAGDPTSYRDTYSITVKAKNAAESTWSYSSYVLYVYSTNALNILLDGAKAGDGHKMSNVEQIKSLWGQGGETGSQAIVALQRDIALKNVISINYGDYAWAALADQIAWKSSDSGVATVNYQQGTLYENIENFSYTSYRPTTDFILSGLSDGTTTVSATHVQTGITDTVTVNVETLRDKLYLFQCYPKAVTTLTYTVYTDASRNKTEQMTLNTNQNGEAAIYAPHGIAGDVYCQSTTKEGDETVTYLGTIYNRNLVSSEADSTKLQLYPVNTLQLRRAAYAEIFLKKPDGTPYAGQVTFRGGVYRQGKYCDQNVMFGLQNAKPVAGKPGNVDQTVTTGTDGRLLVTMDLSQFKSSADQADVQAGEKLYYIFQLEYSDDTHYPIFLRVDANLNMDDVAATGDSIVAWKANEAKDNAKKPFIAAQTIQYSEKNTASVANVRESTGHIGPSTTFPTAWLTTTVLWWGDEVDEGRGNTVTLLDDTNKTVPGQTSRKVAYPFSDMAYSENVTVLNQANMTNWGVAKGQSRSLTTALSRDGKQTDLTITLPFRVVNMIGASQAEEASILGSTLDEIKRGLSVNGEIQNVDDKMLQTGMKLLAGDAKYDSSQDSFAVRLFATSDPMVFRAFFCLNVGNMGSDENVSGVYPNYENTEDMAFAQTASASQKGDEGLFPSAMDIYKIAKGQYKGELIDEIKDADAGKAIRSFNMDLGGYFEADIVYDMEKQEWDCRPISGGFHAGGGVNFTWNFNAVVGIVPVTTSLTLGGTIELSMDMQQGSYYKIEGGAQQVTGLEGYSSMTDAQIKSEVEKLGYTTDTANDYLTQLRLFFYVKTFAGLGFDLSVVAFKIGVFGQLNLDMNFAWLNRSYLNDNDKLSAVGPADSRKDSVMNGQELYVSGSTGIEFMFKLAFISYEHIFCSVGFKLGGDVNDTDTIDKIWAANKTINNKPVQRMRMPNGQVLYSVDLGAQLEGRDYVDIAPQSWVGGMPSNGLFSLDRDQTVTLAAALQTGAYSYANPVLSDDGAMMLYLSDRVSGDPEGAKDVTNTRVAWSVKNNGQFPEGTRVNGTNDVSEGYGDSSVKIAGENGTYAAAWVRQMENFTPDRTAAGIGGALSEGEQMLQINSSEIVAGIYSGNSWMLHRLTNNGTPDLAPVVATSGSRTVVAWREVSPTSVENLMDFNQQDAIRFAVYERGSWSTTQTLYDGTGTGAAVKGIEAAMLSDGTAAVVYTLDTNASDGSNSDWETVLAIIPNGGNARTGDTEKSENAVRTFRLTTDGNLDENPQITTVNFGSNENRFVVAWHTQRAVGTNGDTESDIRLAALDGNGVFFENMPESLGKAAEGTGETIGSNFRFAKNAGSIDNLAILWTDTVGGDGTANTVDSLPNAITAGYGDMGYDVLKTVKFVKAGESYTVSGVVEAAAMANSTLIDHFDAYTETGGTIKSILLGTSYAQTGERAVEISNGGETSTATITVPIPVSGMYTATAMFDNRIELSAMALEYEKLYPNSDIDVQFTVRNSGKDAITKLEIAPQSGGDAYYSTEHDPLYGAEGKRLNLLPNQDITVTARIPTGATIENVAYTIKATFQGQNDPVTLSDTLYLDIPDVGISKLEVTREQDGQRTLRYSLYNALSAQLGDNGGWRVQVGFYGDPGYATPLKDSNQNDLVKTISGQTDLAMIDAGGYSAEVTLPVGSYVADGNEIPDAGIPVYVKAWVETPADARSRTGEYAVVTEYFTANNAAALTLDNLAQRRGKDVTIHSTLENPEGANGSEVTVDVQYNKLTGTASGNLIVILLDESGRPVEKLQSYTESGEGNGLLNLSNEETAQKTFQFSKKGSSVQVEFSDLVLNSNSVELDHISLTGAEVVYNAETQTYTATGANLTSGSLEIAPKDPNAQITVNGKAYDINNADTVSLPSGSTTWTIEVTNGENSKTYSLVLTNPNTTYVPPSSTGSGGNTSGDTGSYHIDVKGADHGKVTSDRNNAANGSTVTLTVIPDSGYMLDTLAVTDSQGNEIKLTDKGNGKYTFTMPNRAVAVNATFVPSSGSLDKPCDGGADCPSRNFADLGTVGTWYHEAVDYALRNGLMGGYGGGQFGPNDSLSRAQLAQILFNKEGRPVVNYLLQYSDVADGAWYTEAIRWATSQGIVGGYGNGKFGPNDPITREQLAVMLWRYAGSPAATNKELHFNDADEVGSWALDAIRWAVENGILNGFGDGRLGPQGQATRAQVAQMLKNFIENQEENT